MKPLRLPKKRSKYGNVKTVIHGKTFDSKAEAERYLVLKDREAKGEILFLECQYEYKLFVHRQLICKYFADFCYWENGAWVVEDVKGHRTREYQLKKKLMKALFDVDILEINVKSKWRRKRK